MGRILEHCSKSIIANFKSIIGASLLMDVMTCVGFCQLVRMYSVCTLQVVLFSADCIFSFIFSYHQYESSLGTRLISWVVKPYLPASFRDPVSALLV